MKNHFTLRKIISFIRNPFKRYFAQHTLARQKAHNADYRARRGRALTPSRRSHIQALLADMDRAS